MIGLQVHHLGDVGYDVFERLDYRQLRFLHSFYEIYR
jgi:hypothetical protein